MVVGGSVDSHREAGVVSARRKATQDEACRGRMAVRRGAAAAEQPGTGMQASFDARFGAWSWLNLASS